jgi:hypothetical protein
MIVHTINDNGAWCWFQDERALVDADNRTLVVGSIAVQDGPGGASRHGDLELTVVDLDTYESQIVTLHKAFEADDHDVPALWRRRDGRWLAMYARHKTDDFLYWRISAPNDPRVWGEERFFDWSEHTEGRGVTYANIHELDGRLYCFSRAVNDDQCALVSDDEGETWRYAGKLFTREKVGYVNGYTRCSSSDGRIDLVTTDHHPRDYNNSIYHGYLAGGALHRSDGSVVDEHALTADAPSPSQVELTRILTADEELDGVALTHAWTSDIRHHPDGTIVAVLTARHDVPANDKERFERNRPILDHRFVYARFTPESGWRTFPLAKAGAGLLVHEQDYTGLVALDPYDANVVYASAPIDPRTGQATEHHEIYRGATADGGASWEWSAITENSDVDNLRPIVAPGDPARTPLLWFRGWMEASQRYGCEVVLADIAR